KQRNIAPEQAAAGAPDVAGRAKLVALRALQSELPAGTVLLEYAVTSSDTYIFAVSKASFKVVRAKSDSSVITGLVNKYVSDVKAKAPMDGLTSTARLLYDYLISPAQDVIGDCRFLCIVPDKVLHFLPFAALVSGDGKFLIERHGVTYAPSSSVL